MKDERTRRPRHRAESPVDEPALEDLGGAPTTGGLAPGGSSTGLRRGEGLPTSQPGAAGVGSGGAPPIGSVGGSGSGAGGLATGIGGTGGGTTLVHGADRPAGAFGTGGTMGAAGAGLGEGSETGEAGTRTGTGGIEPGDAAVTSVQNTATNRTGMGGGPK